MKKPINKIMIMFLVFSFVLSIMVGTGNVFSSAPNDNLQKIVSPSTDDTNPIPKGWDGVLTAKGITQSGIKFSSLSYGVISPRDPATGLPTGKRMHKPFVITKELDKSSPLLYQKLIKDEVLPEVLLTFTNPSEKSSYTVKLINAHIVQIDSLYDAHAKEEITIVAEKIELKFTNSIGGTTSASEDSPNWSFGVSNSTLQK